MNDNQVQVPPSKGWSCPQCQTESRAGTLFCLRCGHQLARECPKCGYMAAITARYCHQCGTDIEAHLKQQAQKEQIWLQTQLARGFQKITCPSCEGAKEIWTDVCPECGGSGKTPYYDEYDKMTRYLGCHTCNRTGHVASKRLETCGICRGAGYIVCDQDRFLEEKQKSPSKKSIFNVLGVTVALLVLAGMGSFCLWLLSLIGLSPFGEPLGLFLGSCGLVAGAFVLGAVASRFEVASEEALLRQFTVYPPKDS